MVKRLLVSISVAVFLFGVLMASPASASRLTLIDEFNAAGVLKGAAGNYLADYLGNLLFDDATQRERWYNAGLITIEGTLASPTDIHLSAYATSIVSGHSVVYNMKVALTSEIYAAYASIYAPESVPEGLAESKAEYLFMDAGMRTRWNDAALITITASSAEPTKPGYITLTSYGETVVENMQRLTKTFDDQKLLPTGVSSWLCDFLFTYDSFRAKWIDANLLTETVDSVSGKVVNIAVTEYGKAAIYDYYDLQQDLKAEGFDARTAETLTSQLFGSYRVRDAFVDAGIFTLTLSSQGYDVWGISAAISPVTGKHWYTEYGSPLSSKHAGWIMNDVAAIAPYASFLALDVAPAESIANILKMWNDHANSHGAYGFFDSFNPTNTTDNSQCYTTISQADILISIANLLKDGAIQDLFAGSAVMTGHTGCLDETLTGLVNPGLSLSRTYSPTDETSLRNIASLTWNYFNDTVTATSHNLPANSYSLTGGGTMTYTSITDIGLYLMSVVSAQELDLITEAQAKTRIQNVVTTLNAMSKWNGLFHNYYDTTTLASTGASNRFISSVDNGWLATGLIVAGAKYADLKTSLDLILNAMDFGELYDTAHDQLVTGVDPDTGVKTASTYGNVYTEIRPTVLLAIAKGDIPATAWESLVTAFPADWEWQGQEPDANGYYTYTVGGVDVKYIPTWDGTMFEALMPNLVINNRTLSPNGFALQDATYVYLQKYFATGSVTPGYTAGQQPINVTTYGQQAIDGMANLIGQLITAGVSADAADSTAVTLFLGSDLRTLWKNKGYLTETYTGGKITGITLTTTGQTALPGMLNDDPNIMLVLELHNAIIAGGLQTAFQTIYGIPVADQDLGNSAYKTQLSGDAGYILSNSDCTLPSYFTQDDYLNQITWSADLQAKIVERGLLDIIAAKDGVSGLPNPATNVEYRYYLIGTVRSPGYDRDTFLAPLEAAKAVDNTLQTNNLRDEFALLYNIPEIQQNFATTAYMEQMDGIAGYIATNTIGYDLADFVAEVTKTAELYSALLAEGDFRLAFESMNSTTVPDPITTEYRQYLSGIIASTPGYTLDVYRTRVMGVGALHQALATIRADFETIYGIAVAQQVMTNDDYVKILDGTLGYMATHPLYTVDVFQAEVHNSALLHAAIVTNGFQDAVAGFSGIAVADQNPVTNADYRGYLAGVVNGEGYDMNAFLTTLYSCQSLHNNIGTAGLREEFELLYGIAVAEQVPTNDAYWDLISGTSSYIMATPDYEINDFLAEIYNAAALHQAIVTNGFQDAVAGFSGIAVADQNPVTNADYRGYLAGVVNGEGYDLSTFLTSLMNGPITLHNALGTNNLREEFALLYGIPVTSQVTTNTTYWDLLNGINGYIASTPDYALSDFLNEVVNAAALHQALIDNGLREAFAYVSKIPVASQDPAVNEAYRAYLAGVVNNDDYNATAYLADLNALGISQTFFDASGRVSKIVMTDGTYYTFQYDAGNNLFKKLHYSATGTWLATYQYHSGSTVVRYEWIADANPSVSGDITYKEYDTAGFLTKEQFDSGNYYTYEYFNGAIFIKRAYLAGGVWQRTTQYWTNTTKVRYEWMAAGVEGNVIYRQYDIDGRIVRETYNDNTFTVFTYQDGKLYRASYYKAGWVWQKSTEYWSDGVTKHYEWFADQNPTVAGDLKENRYDATGRLDMITYDDASNFRYAYWGSTTTKYQEWFYNTANLWQWTIQYYEDGVNKKYEWLADQNPTVAGDVFERRYDLSGRVTMVTYDDKSNVRTSYWGTTTNKYQVANYDTANVWQRTVQYWENGTTKRYEWIKSGLEATDTYREYDNQERLIKRRLYTPANGALSYQYVYNTTTGYQIKDRGYVNNNYTSLLFIDTRFNNANNRLESYTRLVTGIQTSDVYADAAGSRLDEQVLADHQSANYDVYYNFMDDGSGKVSFKALASLHPSGDELSYMYSYYATGEKHYEYVYTDQLWNAFKQIREYDTAGNVINTYATYQAPAAGDVQEVDQRLAVQTKVQTYGTTANGGFTFTPAMNGEPANPLNAK